MIPVRHEVYGFLKKMESKGIIREYHDIVKPLSRREAARWLQKVDGMAANLTSTDLKRLTFLQEEFGYEMGFSDPSWTEAPRRWHLVSIPINGGILNADPILGFRETRFEGKRVGKLTNGFTISGYAFGNVGFLFTFADNHEKGPLLDQTKMVTQEDGIPGLITPKSADNISYDFTDAQLSYETENVLVSLEKITQTWATGRRGSISFSQKAPSAPQLRFQARLTDWITFTYIHAELSSRVLDSSKTYRTYSSGIRDFVRPVYRQKYMAAHMLEFTPIDGVDLTLGESIVYSDRNPSLIYLLPVMFFKSGEHYNYDTDNTQFHISADLTLIPGANIYGSLIIDEIKPGDIFSGLDESRNQVGYTIGVQTFDILMDDIEFTVEYTRLNPWVYSHKYPAARFTNNGYDMGHWIGQNADNIYGEVTYWAARELKITGWVESFRKGGIDDVAYQYQLPSKEFLYGLRRTERSAGLGVTYQPVRDLSLDASVRSFSLTDESNLALNHDAKFEFIAQIRYGIW